MWWSASPRLQGGARGCVTIAIRMKIVARFGAHYELLHSPAHSASWLTTQLVRIRSFREEKARPSIPAARQGGVKA